MLEKWLGWMENATLYDTIIEVKHLKWRFLWAIKLKVLKCLLDDKAEFVHVYQFSQCY